MGVFDIEALMRERRQEEWRERQGRLERRVSEVISEATGYPIVARQEYDMTYLVDLWRASHRGSGWWFRFDLPDDESIDEQLVWLNRHFIPRAIEAWRSTEALPVPNNVTLGET